MVLAKLAGLLFLMPIRTVSSPFTPNPEKTFMNNNTDLSEQLSTLRQDIKALDQTVRGFLIVLIAVSLFYVSRILLLSANFESIYADMLGDLTKAPVITRLIFESPMPILGCLWALTSIAIFLILKSPRSFHAGTTGLFTLLCLIACTHLITTSMLEPLLKVVKALSGE